MRDLQTTRFLFKVFHNIIKKNSYNIFFSQNGDLRKFFASTLEYLYVFKIYFYHLFDKLVSEICLAYWIIWKPVTTSSILFKFWKLSNLEKIFSTSRMQILAGTTLIFITLSALYKNTNTIENGTFISDIISIIIYWYLQKVFWFNYAHFQMDAFYKWKIISFNFHILL